MRSREARFLPYFSTIDSRHPGRPNLRIEKLSKAKRAASASSEILLETKVQPHQDRSKSTFDTILVVAGDLLAESGFEQLTTNKISERASLSTPAIYRYFPNKYAILNEMAARLMDLQDQAVFAWIEAGGMDAPTLDDVIEKYFAILKQVNEITRDHPGGVSVMRAIRAIPLLHETRLGSRDRVADQLFLHLRRRSSRGSDEELRIATRVSIELMYAATEMVVGEPGPDDDKVTHEVCVMIGLYLERFR
jgi:AcrR family transcriptional regulator